MVIYGLYDPLTKELRYVGCTTKTLKNRLNNHLREAVARDYNSLKIKWIRGLQSQNLKPEIRPIQETNEQNYILDEKRYIEHFRSMGCNLTNTLNGGEGFLNAAKAKIGIHIPEYHKDKISSFFRKFNDEEIRKIKELEFSGVPQKEICQLFNMNRRTLYRIVHDKMRYSKSSSN